MCLCVFVCMSMLEVSVTVYLMLAIGKFEFHVENTDELILSSGQQSPNER